MNFFLVYLSIRELLWRYLYCMCYIEIAIVTIAACKTFHSQSIEVGSVYMVYCYCMQSVVDVSIRFKYCRLIGVSLMLVSNSSIVD